jgi:hypothetical protein
MNFALLRLILYVIEPAFLACYRPYCFWLAGAITYKLFFIDAHIGVRTQKLPWFWVHTHMNGWMNVNKTHILNIADTF